MKKSDKISSMKDLSNQNILHVQTDEVDYLRFPVFDQYGVAVIDAIRGRQGLDYVGDDTEPFRAICAAIGADVNKIVRIHEQLHSDICVRVDASDQGIPNCDALMTNVPGIVLVTREADCVPILIYDPVQKVVANVHSGWRGTVKYIVRAAIMRMNEEYGSESQDLICALLPAIGADHFFVRDDVRLPFEREFGDAHLQPKDDGYLLDMVACVKDDLLAIGVPADNIKDSGICAVCESDQINSSRGGAGKMRNAAMIFMKEETHE